jgi:hypothetical protein
MGGILAMAFVLPCGFVQRTGFLTSALIILLPAAHAQTPPPDPAASFQDRVQPIVFKNCNGCHTFGGHAGKLRMDSFATLMKGGGRGPAVVPGHPESSLLLRAVQYNDPDLKMPPRGKLADSDIAGIEKWILELPTDAVSIRARVAPEPVAVKTAETPIAAPKTTVPPPPAPATDVAPSKISSSKPRCGLCWPRIAIAATPAPRAAAFGSILAKRF